MTERAASAGIEVFGKNAGGDYNEGGGSRDSGRLGGFGVRGMVAQQRLARGPRAGGIGAGIEHGDFTGDQGRDRHAVAVQHARTGQRRQFHAGQQGA